MVVVSRDKFIKRAIRMVAPSIINRKMWGYRYKNRAKKLIATGIAAKFPESLNLGLSTICQAKCIYCPSERGKSAKAFYGQTKARLRSNDGYDYGGRINHLDPAHRRCARCGLLDVFYPDSDISSRPGRDVHPTNRLVRIRLWHLHDVDHYPSGMVGG